MKTVKEAADILLKKGEITQEEYNDLEKQGAFSDSLKGAAKGLAAGIKNFVGWKPLNEYAGQLPAKGSFSTLPSNTFYEKAGLAGRQILESGTKGLKSILPITAGLAAAGIVGKEVFFDPGIQERKIEDSYNTMLQKTPILAGEDQAKIRDYFDVVKTFAPHAAANPLVAGSLVNKMVQFGGVDHKLVQDMVALQEGHASEGIVSKVIEGGIKTITGVPKTDKD